MRLMRRLLLTIDSGTLEGYILETKMRGVKTVSLLREAFSPSSVLFMYRSHVVF